MNFFKKIFSAKDQFVPTPKQDIPGIEPIIVHTVEILFPNTEDQKELFKDLIENRKDVSDLLILSILSMCTTLEDWKRYNILPGPHPNNIQYFIARDSGFFSMQDAEKWVKSITKS